MSRCVPTYHIYQRALRSSDAAIVSDVSMERLARASGAQALLLGGSAVNPGNSRHVAPSFWRGIGCISMESRVFSTLALLKLGWIAVDRDCFSNGCNYMYHYHLIDMVYTKQFFMRPHKTRERRRSNPRRWTQSIKFRAYHHRQHH